MNFQQLLRFCFTLLVVIVAQRIAIADDETSMTIGLGTDVASILIFHPDSLSSHKDDPIAWYSAPFAIKKDLEEGRLVGFSTGSDGGYRFRLTTDALTDREEKFKRCAVDFRLKVEHDWVAIDNSSGLPGEQQMTDLKKRPKQQFKLQNGLYRVTVVGIDWHKEPGGVDSNGVSTESALPSYVIRFQSVDDFSEIKVPPCLPDLLGKQPSYPAAEMAKTSRNIHPLIFDEEKSYPLLLTDSALKLSRSLLRLKFDKAEKVRLGLLSPDRAGLAGPEFGKADESDMSEEEKTAARRARFKAHREWFDEVKSRRFVVANTATEGSVANCCTITSLGMWKDGEVATGFAVIGTLKLTDVSQSESGAVCHATLVKTEPSDDPKILADLKEAFAEYAQTQKIKAPDYYTGLLRQQSSMGRSIRIVFDHFEVSPERFVEYAVQDEATQAQMLIEDLRAQQKK